jgi:hypothetical protein
MSEYKLSVDISSMLDDLMSFTEAQIKSGNLQKSVSFGEVEVFEGKKDDDARLPSTTALSGILKTPSSTVLPCEVPLKPVDSEYMEDLDSSGSSASDLSETSDENELKFSSDEDEGNEEDFEADDLEPETSAFFFEDGEVNDTSSVFEQVTIDDYKSFDGLLESLDQYMKNKSGSSPLEPKGAIPEPPFPTSSLPVYPFSDPVDINSATSHTQNTSINKDDIYPSSDDDKPIMHTLRSPDPNLPPLVLNTTEMIMSKLNDANIRKITIRIYIETSKTYKTCTLNSLMTALQVVKDLKSEPGWTLFEICTEEGIERPLRDWEIVTDVVSAWGATSPNVMLIKQYGFRHSLVTSNLTGKYPRIQGFMYLLLGPGKWQKRFCYLKEYCLYYLVDKKVRPQNVINKRILIRKLY